MKGGNIKLTPVFANKEQEELFSRCCETAMSGDMNDDSVKSERLRHLAGGRNKRLIEEADRCLDDAIAKVCEDYRQLRISALDRNRILKEYEKICEIFKGSYVKGQLDSFEKAACLMSAIQRVRFVFYGDGQVKDLIPHLLSFRGVSNYKSNDELSAELALHAALFMCEDPIIYTGDSLFHSTFLGRFEYQQFAQKYPEEWAEIMREMEVATYHSFGKMEETKFQFLMLKYLYKLVNARVSMYSDACEAHCDESCIDDDYSQTPDTSSNKGPLVLQ